MVHPPVVGVILRGLEVETRGGEMPTLLHLPKKGRLETVQWIDFIPFCHANKISGRRSCKKIQLKVEIEKKRKKRWIEIRD